MPTTDYFGTPNNDVIIRTTNDARIFGLGGNDVLMLTAAAPIGPAYGLIDGADGNDSVTLKVSAAADVALGQIDGGQGNDSLNLTVTANAAGALASGVVNGGDGNDSIVAKIANKAGLADATIDGGTGNDAISLTLQAGETLVGNVHGGDGNDAISVIATVSPGATGAPIDVVLALFGDSGNDAINVSAQGKEHDIQVDGGDGNDAMNVSVGGAVETAIVHMVGGIGNDAIVASLPTGIGSALLEGNAGDDNLTVVGGATNTLDGGDGKDTMTGGSGDETFTGGGGADRCVVKYLKPSGSDHITDFNPDTTLTFDDLTADPEAIINDGYGGFDWDNAFVLDVPEFNVSQPGNGYRAVSEPNVGFNGFPPVNPSVTIEHANQADDFDFISGWFSGAYKDDLRVTVDAYDDGVKVGSQDIVLDFANATKFTFGFTSVDKIVFTVDPTSGTVQLDNAPNSNDYFGFDNLTFRLAGDEGDVIQLKGATPANVQTVIDNAQQVGVDTQLTLPNGTLTLENFTATDLTIDMFLV